MNLYLDIDGVLMDYNTDTYAKGAIELIEYITCEFDCYWLTAHCKGDSMPAIECLSEYFPPEEVGWSNHILGREVWFMMGYPLYEIDRMNLKYKYIDMETFIDILLVCVLISLSTLPILCVVSLVMLRKMYNEWKTYMDKHNDI